MVPFDRAQLKGACDRPKVLPRNQQREGERGGGKEVKGQTMSEAAPQASWEKVCPEVGFRSRGLRLMALPIQ